MTTRTQHMKLATCMALFQGWRRITGRTTHDYGPTLATAKEDMVKDRIRAMRPQCSWNEIA